MTKPRFGHEKPAISYGEAVEIISGPGPKRPKLRPPTNTDIMRGLDLPPGFKRGDFRLR